MNLLINSFLHEKADFRAARLVIAENKGHVMKKIQPELHPANERNFLYKDLL